MKKILLVLLLIIIMQKNCFAQDEISFVYINGSNTNDKKMTKWYETGVKKLHPCMKKAFDEDPYTKNYFLSNNKYHIQKEPIIFFWGDRSHKDLSFVEKDLAASKGFSPWVAYQVRASIMHYLHDAIWVQKYHNMLPVLEDLHKVIKEQSHKGNKVVLYGYSAGSFVTYEYLLTRLPYINVAEFFNSVGVSEEQKNFIKSHPMNNTCMAALGKDLAVFSATGQIVPNDSSKAVFETDYLNLNEVTNNVCAPKATVKGIINFASPLVLFYSDLSDPNFKLTYYNKLLIEYLIENDMFWLTVNYREDPLGFPCGRNLKIEEIEDITNLDIDPHNGFMYDQSDTGGKTFVFAAHTSYWATKKNFSKAVVRAYKNGHKLQYGKINNK